MHKKFTLWHSLAGTAVLLVAEYASSLVWHEPFRSAGTIIGFAVVGSLINLYVATEVIEEVHHIRYMLTLLSVVVVEFVVFFAFQYWMLLLVLPQSFPTLGADPVSLLLCSVMAFVFNPLYLPSDAAGRGLLLVHTLSAIGLVLFILQNIWQFRRKEV